MNSDPARRLISSSAGTSHTAARGARCEVDQAFGIDLQQEVGIGEGKSQQSGRVDHRSSRCLTRPG
ncbi:MAG: hypothetical protein WDM86_03650 [Rhizomicrobium sp.]